MRIVCENCGASADPSALEINDGVIAFTCAACGHRTTSGGAERSTAPASPTPSASFTAPVPSPDLPPVKCPKCGHRQHDDKACHRCGLVFALVERSGVRPWEAPPPGKEAAVRRAEELWAPIAAGGGTREAHDAFYAHCRSSNLSVWAAMRYQHWTADFPDDAIAGEYRARAVVDAQRLATALTGNAATGFADSAGNARRVLFGVAVVLAIVAAFFVVKIMRATSAASVF